MIDLCHYISHERLNVQVLLRAGFVVLHVVLLGHLTCIVLANLSVLFPVDLISDEDFCNVFVRMLVDTFEPHFHVLERVRIRHVEAEYDSLRLLVEAEREGAEPFLSGCVPNFHLHRPASCAIRRLEVFYDVVEAQCRHM